MMFGSKMNDEPKCQSWDLIVNSVIGNSHIRNGLPNQDSFGCKYLSENEDAVILTVSDGHGSANSFRSDIGSKIAVNVTINAFTEIYKGFLENDTKISIIKREIEEKLPKEIIKIWRAEVDTHLLSNPISDDEKKKLTDVKGKIALEKINENPYIIYGATLLAVLVTNTFIIYLQLGDGDIIEVYNDNEIRRPIPKDERLIANETTSLCSKEAWKDIYICYQTMLDTQPDLIMLSTDGYLNSYTNENEFYKVSKDYLNIYKEEGIEFIKSNIEDWLNDVSKNGSGDDISAAIVFKRQKLTS